ncbi:hypothetical protein [uncultured Christiangramia sp.]|uniref:hypothetical protein n=1 Tax=Christiangramia sp. 3-2217-3z TaxID=3417564 RepID=UPI002605F561|nr:hypothetical protein [uncultured Christiangramia sp.]
MLQISGNERKISLRGSDAESIQENNSLERVYHKIYESFRRLQNENKLLKVEMIKANYWEADDSFKKLSELLNYQTSHMREVLKYGTMKNNYNIFANKYF